MAILSFGWTAQYLPPDGTKDTTRRRWCNRTFNSWCKAWDEGRRIHDAVDKGLHRGGQRIGKIELTERPYKEVLCAMPESDLIREGGMVSTVDEFIDKYFCGKHLEVVTVIRFRFTPF
jgi:hypothetical protein